MLLDGMDMMGVWCFGRGGRWCDEVGVGDRRVVYVGRIEDGDIHWSECLCW